MCKYLDDFWAAFITGKYIQYAFLFCYLVLVLTRRVKLKAQPIYIQRIWQWLVIVIPDMQQ